MTIIVKFDVSIFTVAIKSKKECLKVKKLTFNTELCKGCGLCISVCPKKILILDKTQLNKKGYHPAAVTNIDDCIACAMCATICPDCVIKVEK